jgi:UDP-N-acetylmuramyl pentapeptide phosphotransferase/UDP-N-acetylglucosamine-1-phosphate transferase
VATRSGGLAIFIALFIISFYHYLLNNQPFDFSLLVPLSILTTVGLYDDIYKLDFKLKFIFQIIAAKVMIDQGLIVDNLHGVFGLFELNRIFAQGLTIIIITAIINSINFIDGIDGLAVSIVISFLIAFEFFSISVTPYINISILIICSLIPLSIFNFRTNNKVFLGDSGSLLLGGVVSIYTIYILTNNYVIKPEFDLHKIVFVMSILIYPIVDITRIFFLRIIKGNSPFKPDRNHIHHVLLEKLKKHSITTLFITFSSIFFIILAQILF